MSRLVSKYARMPLQDIQEAGKDPKTPALEVLIAATLLKSIQTGDYYRFSLLMERVIGRVPNQDRTDEETEARKELQKLTDQELIRIVKEKLPAFEGSK